jgi:hypothetical protein
MIHHIRYAHFPGAMGTAEEGPLGLDSVTQDLAAAMGTDRRKFMSSALETVKHMLLAGGYDLE